MEFIKYYLFLSFPIGAIVAVICGLLAYFQNRRRLINITWLFLNLFSALWSTGYFIMISAKSESIAWFGNWLLHGAAIFIPPLYFHFVLSFTNKLRNYRKYLYIAYISAAILFVLNPTKFFVEDVYPRFIFNYTPRGGPLFFLFALHFWWLVSLATKVLYDSYKMSEGIRARQIRYILLGEMGFLGGGSTFLYTFGINIPPYTMILFVFYPIVMTYAILRYRLMDIRAIIARTIAFGFIVAILISLYAIVTAIIAQFFENLVGTKSTIIAGVVLSLFIAAGYRPLRRFIEQATDRFLFKKSYNPEVLLANVNRVTSSILDLQNLLKSIAKSLADAFQFEKIGVVLLNEQRNLEIIYQEGFKPEVAQALTSFPNVTKILFQELKQNPGIQVIDEMKTRYDNGEFKPVSPELLEALHTNDVAIILPLTIKERLIGVIALGTKKSGDPYNNQDIGVLGIIAGQAAIAIENARLYEELKGFNVKLEAEVNRKTAALRQANLELRKLDQAKSDFISIASHQLRTPLTIIKGYISMMKEGNFGPVPAVIMKNLDKVYISNERLISLVENLLDISRIESGKQDFNWQSVQLEDLAQTVADNLKPAAKIKGLKLFFHRQKNLTPKVIADSNKVHEVMMNFTDNAIKYTEKGEINVSLNYDDHKKMVTFCVKDTGRGLEKDVKSYLFKKFSRGKGSFRIHTEGVGLGLYVAKIIVDAHHGKVWAESEGSDKGSRFCFSLPLEGPGEKEIKKQQEQEKRRAKEGKAIRNK